MTNKDTAPSLVKRVMATPTITKADEDMAGTVVESGSNATGYKLQVP